ncbi:MAG: agmatinase family protein [Ilumatobacter sp.]|jgi:arginase|uniref:agmatinase family protein n=1 Tax=Ilumatobacter sp. TaxID=1967498 RepID=UPI001DF2FD0D|nr:agmatinase family protein [Ilumatobacter sp.]MBT5276634.1 agmatinase family protein [Ilumatobacter sp.]MBT5554086.1 agmatinase family protein [Ilumatobacter sp.]MBT5865200.1 agmatinase family protein [Ilumatobacter sp.]MDG0977350.1 agmatinase family protein [Ilumatobacter sp.]
MISLLGVPLDANSSHLVGPALGPAAIRVALHSGSGNHSSEASVEVVDQLDDVGDVAIVNERGSHADADAITAAVAAQLDDGRQIITLGGDHSITFPILRAFRAQHDNLTVVHIDAHPDLYDDLDGNPLSHASPFARALEAGCMTTLVQLGIRTATPHQREQAAKWGVTMLSSRQLGEFDPSTLSGPIYLTIDLDGLDPSVAPGVSHHEPGGLTVREVLDIIDSLPGPLVGADVVELNPTRDLVAMTAMVGAKLVKEIAAAMLRSA